MIFPIIGICQSEKPLFEIRTGLTADFNVNQNGNYDILLNGFFATKRMGEFRIIYIRNENFISSEYDLSNLEPRHIFNTREETMLTHTIRFNNKKKRQVFSMENSFYFYNYSADNSLRFIENRHLQNVTLQRLEMQRNIQQFKENFTWDNEIEISLNKRTSLEIIGGLSHTNDNNNQVDIGHLEMPVYNNQYAFNNSYGFNQSKTKGSVSLHLKHHKHDLIYNKVGYNGYNGLGVKNKWENILNFNYSAQNIEKSLTPELTSLDNQQHWARTYLFDYQNEEYNLSNKFLYQLLEKEKISLDVDYTVKLYQGDFQQHANDSIFRNRVNNQFLTNNFTIDINLKMGKWLSPKIEVGYKNIFRNLKLSETSPTAFLAVHSPMVNVHYGILLFNKLAFNFNYFYGIQDYSWGTFYQNSHSLQRGRSDPVYTSSNGESSVINSYDQMIQYFAGSLWSGNLDYANKHFSIRGNYRRSVNRISGYENTPFNSMSSMSSLQQVFIPNPHLEIPISDLFNLDTKFYFFKAKKHSLKTNTDYKIVNGAVAPNVVFPYEDMLVLYGFDFMPGTMLTHYENVDNIITLRHNSTLNFNWKIKKTYFDFDLGMNASVREFPMIWNEELNSNYYLSANPFTEIKISYSHGSFVKLKYGLIYGAFSNELDANAFNDDVFGIHHVSLIHQWKMRMPISLTTFVNAYHRTRLDESIDNYLLFCNMELSYHRPKKRGTRNPKSWKRKDLQRNIYKNKLDALSIGVHDLFNQNNRAFRIVAPYSTTDYSQQVFTRFIYLKISISLFNYRYTYHPNEYRKKFRVS